jgi:aminoglycoside phosphotransferase (APT) family kinase protein
MTEVSRREFVPLPTDMQLERLTAALAPSGAISWSRRLNGGLSCAMDVVTVTDPDVGSRTHVLRRYQGDDHADSASAVREARALNLARSAGVPVPEVIWIDGEGIFREPALVLTFLDGDPPAGSIDTGCRAEQMAESLVCIHSAALEERDVDLLERYVPGEGDDGVTVPAPLRAHPLGPALLDRIRSLRRSLAPTDAGLLHGDYHPGNTLWRGDRLVAVVDWEVPGIGDPAFDVAYCATDIRYLGLDEAADRFIDAYRTMSGRRLPNLTYWTAIALARAMPDVGSWLPAFATLDATVTASALRRRHADLVEAFLAG